MKSCAEAFSIPGAGSGPTPGHALLAAFTATVLHCPNNADTVPETGGSSTPISNLSDGSLEL